MARGKLIFRGKVGGSLFHRPYTPLPGPQDLPELFRKAQAARDDRSFAISTLLVVENRLDALLGQLMPGYRRLLKPPVPTIGETGSRWRLV